MGLAQKTFGEIITFTRNSAATRFNHLGQLETVAANQPRITHGQDDILVLGPELVTNGDFSNGITGWQTSGLGAYVVSNGEASKPNTNFGSISQTIGLIPGRTYQVKFVITLSISYTTLVLGGNSISGVPLNATNALVILTGVAGATGVLSFSSPAGLSTIKNISVREITGYAPRKDNLGLLIEEQRANLLLNSAAPATQSMVVSGTQTTLSFTGTGSISLTGAHAATLVGTGANNRVTRTFSPAAGMLTATITGDVRNANLEVGPEPTTHIPTSGAQATRAADAPIVPLGPWFRAQEGSFYARFFAPPNTGERVVFDLSNGSAAERLKLTVIDGTLRLLITAGGIEQANISLGAVTPGANVRCALRYAANDIAAVVNNGTVQTDTSAALPVATTLRLGHDPFGNHLNSVLADFDYFPRAMTNAQLQALTA